jgi:hypothetical protein
MDLFALFVDRVVQGLEFRAGSIRRWERESCLGADARRDGGCLIVP